GAHEAPVQARADAGNGCCLPLEERARPLDDRWSLGRARGVTGVCFDSRRDGAQFHLDSHPQEKAVPLHGTTKSYLFWRESKREGRAARPEGAACILARALENRAGR